MLRSPADLAAFVRQDPLCLRLAELGRRADRELVLVGGCVRDWLLDRPALDWDVIVPGDPAPLLAELKAVMGRRAAPLDEAFGVYRLPQDGGPSIDFTRLQGESLDADLRRRDLTINALAVRLEDGQLLDPTGGLGDLQAGRIRAVSRANLEDDPLRLLRVFRFAARLPGEVEPETLTWVEALAPQIQRSAGERIWAELLKLLPAPAVVASMERHGLLAYVMPEAAPGAAARLAFHELDARSSAAVPWPLAAVVAMVGADPAAVEAVAARLRWSKHELTWARRVATGLPAAGAAHLAEEPRLARFRVVKAAQDAVPGLAALAAGWDPAPLLADHWRRVDHPPPRLIDGKALMQALDLPPGPDVARLLTAIEEAQALDLVHDHQGALALAKGIM